MKQEGHLGGLNPALREWETQLKKGDSLTRVCATTLAVQYYSARLPV